MTEYRDVLGASLERLESLERDLVQARRGDGTERALALALENELLSLDREWRAKQEQLAAAADRRATRLKVASALLFLLLALSGIGLLFLGTTLAGFVCFVASIAGWILAGLRESGDARLMRLYEHDRRRVDRMLGVVRASVRGMARARVATAPVGEGAPSEDEQVEAEEAGEAETRR